MYDNKYLDEPRAIGVQIRTLRQARDWSLAKLAEKVGTSAPTLHRYESGWDRFELATLRRIAAALDARLDVRFVPGSDSGPEPSRQSSGNLRTLLSPLFWDKSLRSSDLDRYRDWVLERVLMFGNWRQVTAVRRYYGDEAVATAVERRGVDDLTRNFWRTMLMGERVASEGA